jgi:hypothetical protein
MPSGERRAEGRSELFCLAPHASDNRSHNQRYERSTETRSNDKDAPETGRSRDPAEFIGQPKRQADHLFTRAKLGRGSDPQNSAINSLCHSKVICHADARATGTADAIEMDGMRPSRKRRKKQPVSI